MAKEPNQEQRQLYANLMQEVKTRISVIDLAVSGHLRLAGPFVREFCWLQLRMLCELTALSCLVAHGDIAFLRPHKLGRSHSADEILERMSRLRTHFYPVAIQMTRQPNERGLHTHKGAIISPSPLPREELLQLYGKTHRHLHRGNLKALLKMDVNAPLDLTFNASEIIGWAQKVNDLLQHHSIFLDEETIIVTLLRNADDNNKVQVAIAQAAEFPLPQTAG